MIIIEFLVFVVSSGVFCSERFRHHLWAVITAGAIATGSSLLFFYHVGAKLAGYENQQPAVTEVIKQVVVKQAQNSQPASVGRPHTCAQNYPAASLRKGEEGATSLAFNILTDGTVDAIKVLSSSGSKRLDDAAVKCVAEWHYRPAIKNGQLAEAPWKATVNWQLPTNKKPAPKETKEEAKPTEPPPPPKEGHAWYDVTSWF